MSWLNILVLSNKESFDIIVLTETFILTNFEFKLPLNFSPVTTFQIFRDSIKYENYILYFSTLIIIIFHRSTVRCLFRREVLVLGSVLYKQKLSHKKNLQVL